MLFFASTLVFASVARADTAASPSAGAVLTADSSGAPSATAAPSADSSTTRPAAPPAPFSLSRPDTAQTVVTLDELMTIAMRQSPLLLARDADRRAALERVPRAGALPDPELTWEFLGAPLDDAAPTSASENRFQVSQRFPFPGKRGLERKEASASADVTGASLDTARLAVATALRKSFYHLHHLHDSIESLEESRDAMQAFAEIAQQRYEVGKSPQQDLLKAHVELATEEARLAAFRAEIPAVHARINAILGRDLVAPLARPEVPDSLVPPERVEDLVARAYRRSPTLRAAEAEVDRATSGVGLAKKEAWPDFTLGAGYMAMKDAPDAWMGMAGITLPIWRGAKVAPARREAEAGLAAAEADRDQIRRDVAASVREARAAVVAAQARAEALDETALPRAEQAFESTRFAYENGSATFLDLLDAQRTLLSLRLDYDEAFMDALMAGADLAAAVGDVPEVPHE
ncbi:MAG: TolC family protein [bacterium]